MNPYSFTVDEACKHSGIGRTKLFELLSNGEIPRRKLGRKTLILAEDLKAFVESLPTTCVEAANDA